MATLSAPCDPGTEIAGPVLPERYHLRRSAPRLAVRCEAALSLNSNQESSVTDANPLLVSTAFLEPPPGEGVPERISLGTRLVTLAVVVLPFAGLVAAVALLWGWGFSWVEGACCWACTC
jgi:hypothetical protein